MGLFDFFGKKGPKTEDITWINHDAKMVGALHIIDQNPTALVVAWSYLTKDEFEKYFNEDGELIKELSDNKDRMVKELNAELEKLLN